MHMCVYVCVVYAYVQVYVCVCSLVPSLSNPQILSLRMRLCMYMYVMKLVGEALTCQLSECQNSYLGGI